MNRKMFLGVVILIVFVGIPAVLIIRYEHTQNRQHKKELEEFCFPKQTEEISQRVDLPRPAVTEATEGFAVTGVGGLTFYYTRPLTTAEQAEFEALMSSPNNPYKRPELLKMSIISFNRHYESEDTFNTIWKDIVAGHITANTAEKRLMDFYQAKYTDNPIDPIITTAQARPDGTLLYVLEAYQQYLYWHNVIRYHGFSLLELEIVSATLRVQWDKKKQRMCETALSLAEAAGFSLYKRMTDGASLYYLPLLDDRVKKAAVRLALSYESKEALINGRSEKQRQIDKKKSHLKQLIKKETDAYVHYVAHTDAYNNRNPSNADNVTPTKKRETPKLLLDMLSNSLNRHTPLNRAIED